MMTLAGWLSQILSDVKAGFFTSFGKPPQWYHTPILFVGVVMAIYRDVKYRILWQYCYRHGHKMVHDLQAGPETGVEKVWCTRCGWSDEIVWY